MANSPQAKKRIRVNEKKRMHNLAITSALKTHYKKALEAVENKSEDAETLVYNAVKAIDKAATKGIIHKNTAARKKSRIMKKHNSMAQA